MDDIDVLEFTEYLKSRKEHYPISDEYNKSFGQTNNVFWTNQKDHMIGWFESQVTLGGGSYSRKTSNFSAKRTYNSLRCSEALLWIAEATGVDSKLVQAAASEAAKEKNRSKRPGIIRSFIPWAIIMKCT